MPACQLRATGAPAAATALAAVVAPPYACLSSPLLQQAWLLLGLAGRAAVLSMQPGKPVPLCGHEVSAGSWLAGWCLRAGATLNPNNELAHACWRCIGMVVGSHAMLPALHSAHLLPALLGPAPATTGPPSCAPAATSQASRATGCAPPGERLELAACRSAKDTRWHQAACMPALCPFCSSQDRRIPPNPTHSPTCSNVDYYQDATGQRGCKPW